MSSTKPQIKDHHRYNLLLQEQIPLVSPREANLLKNDLNQRHLQPDINQGMIGHVAHGKTSLTELISGVRTTKYEEEKKRNITIRLGYANFKIFKCINLFCEPPACYQSHGSHVTNPKCKICGSDMELKRHMSFVDCPGHEMLIWAMLSGAAVMDSAILVIATNEHIPQPQTAEHLAVAEIMRIKDIITVQNKCDLVTREEAFAAKDQITHFLAGGVAESSPIIPMSCAPKFVSNLDVLLQYLVTHVPTPQRDLLSPAHMQIIRSFDINKPGTLPKNLKGGVCGGSLIRGVLRVGEIVEIRPGLVFKDAATGKTTVTPLISKVTAMFSENNSLKSALPGGLIAAGLTIDPVLTKNDRLVGQVLGRLGTLPDVYMIVDVQYTLIKRAVGVQDENKNKVKRPIEKEILTLTVGSASTKASVVSVDNKRKVLNFLLEKPICAEIGDQVSLSRKMDSCWRLIGCGEIKSGKPMKLESII